MAEVRASFTPENRAYARANATLGFVSPLFEIALALAILFTGLSARLRDRAHAMFARRYARVLAYFVMFSVVVFVLELPLEWFRGFALEHRFGLSNQSFAAWLQDEAKSLVVSIVLVGATGLLALAYAAIERSPKRWWLWLTLGAIPVTIVANVFAPILIDPLYNRFTPLTDPSLRREIIALAEKTGIPGRDVYQVDRSRQTNKYNAYVSGFGASQRIVLWDTTLRGMKRDEILFVMGHEMGHYKLHHAWKVIAFTSALIGALLFSSWLVMSRLIARFGARWRFRELHDIASLPLLLACVGAASLVAAPITNAFTRSIEHQADVFGLEVTHLNDAAARAFIELGSNNRQDPEPSRVVELFQYSHPPLIERVRFATSYRPWERGEPNREFRPEH